MSETLDAAHHRNRGESMDYSASSQHLPFETCASCEARRSGLCGLLDKTVATALFSRTQNMRYKASEEIVLQGEVSDRIGIIASGLVKIVLLTPDGENHLLELLKPGQLVGDLSKRENAFSWETVTPTTICWISREALDQLIHDRPQVYRAYLEMTARQLEENRLWVAAMRGRKTLQRIAFWVFQQIPHDNDLDGPIINIDLSRRDLASLLDMTVETLCRGLHQLSDKGAIALHASDEIEILDIVNLRHVARCEDCHKNQSCRLEGLGEGPDNLLPISRYAPRNPELGNAANSGHPFRTAAKARQS
ncbi:Crp/Fnr family transcriptional regulator [Roseovarius sp. S1116L3]|uniref:Crp/Fnr family transcriptional regulator n=1 Tax=Roseovarius roseus TaxID=3342636 RepID=UPI0037277373